MARTRTGLILGDFLTGDFLTEVHFAKTRAMNACPLSSGVKHVRPQSGHTRVNIATSRAQPVPKKRTPVRLFPVPKNEPR